MSKNSQLFAKVYLHWQNSLKLDAPLCFCIICALEKKKKKTVCDLLPRHICMRQRAISVQNELQFPFEAAHYPCPLPSLAVTLPQDSCTLRTFGQNPSQDPANQYATGTFLIMQFIHSTDCLYPHFIAWTTYIPISPLVFYLFL